MFPKWTNGLRTAVLLLVLGGGAYAGGIVYFGFSPTATDVGYMPEQPIPYSHALHVGRLGLDCRYCHTTVEESAHASVPPLKTCIGCHSSIRRQEDPRASRLIAEMIDAYESGRAIRWVKVHDLPDYAYFSHAAHVRRGVGCISCHGRVDRMEVVYQHAPLSMGWCLECHRNPEQHLRPIEEVTNMNWTPPGGRSQADYGLELKAASLIKPSQDCSTCHR